MSNKNNSSTTLGYEDKLWLAADKLRGNIKESEYQHVVLGLIFLKYVSDAFETKYEELKIDSYADEEDVDEYTAENIFWVPKEARWNYINKYANSPEIGKIIDNAMELIEKENPRLKGILNKNYAREDLDKTRLGELVTLFTNLEMGTNKAKEMDMFGRVYEYFIGKFASKEKKGEFYTPACIVRTLVEMIEPYNGRVYDPACGSGGMFVQSTKFIKEHQGNINNISIYGQEFNSTTWKIAKMNLAIRGIDGDLGSHSADTLLNDLHKNLKADYILANPPFNISDWGGEKLTEDLRWKYGVPPTGNANYAWLQHMLHHLNPENGVAGTVLANGSLSSDTSNEGVIRKNMIDDDKVECIVAMPSKLFYAVTLPCCLWIMRRKKNENNKNKILFIDARNLGTMITRNVRELKVEDISKIADTYHNWRNNENYEDVLGFCKSAVYEEIKENNYVLTPGRYVGTEESEDDGIPFEEKMQSLTEELSEHIKRSEELNEKLKKVLGTIGYGI